ncbi:MAG TPA: 3-hydroxybutyrate dehydrogenase [Planctomycetota bacterium]|nr:3-hydroxybutyrate dehydrogenase [Planctomycetota bacterium]
MPTDRKQILISGAGSGLGRGMAEFLARRGHAILAIDLNEAGAQETAALIKKAGGQASAHKLDVTSENDVTALFAKLPAPVDVLVNNAGLQFMSKLEDYPTEKWDLLINVMVKGPFLLTRAALPGMRKQNYGRIVNIGSIHALVASRFKSAYTTAKHALIGFTKTIALETADADITVNTLCPSYIFTPLVEKQIQSQMALNKMSEAQVRDEIFLKPMPKHAFITSEELAAYTEFLMSHHARNITGQSLAIDGGWTVQ